MRIIFWILLSLTIIGSQTHCTVIGKDYIVDDKFEEQDENIGEKQLNRNLADVLRKNTSLTVEGQHPNVSITVRGMSSIRGDNRVLFVVDGIRMGHDYYTIQGAVDINRIKRIKVLRGLSETNIYGEDGRNGVIQIYQYKSE